MKLEINRLEMLEAAKSAAKVAPSRAPLDILNGILIEGDENRAEVFLTATDFDVSIQSKVKASVEESGSMLVDPRTLVGMLTLLSGEFVEFSANNQERLKVSAEKCVYEINCLSANHYPKPVMPFPEDVVKITGICSLAKRTVFAVSKDGQNSAMQCVSVKLKQNALHAAACDGTRMMLVKSEAESTENQDFLLPGHSLQLLASISSDQDVFEVGDIGQEVVFTRANMMFSMRKLPGTFMDVNMVVKSVIPAYTAIVDARKIRDTLDLIAIGSSGQPANLVMRENEIILSCNGEIGAAQSVIEANVSESTPKAGFYYDINKLSKLFQIVDGKIKIELDKKGMMLVKSRSEVYFQLPQNKPKPIKKEKEKKTEEAA